MQAAGLDGSPWPEEGDKGGGGRRREGKEQKEDKEDDEGYSRRYKASPL